MSNEKKIISPFEFAIMQSIGEDTSNVRPETPQEKETRIKEKFIVFANKIKVKR